MVLRGSGRMKLDGEIVEVEMWDVERVPPGTWRGYEAGPEGSRSPSSAGAKSQRGSARRRRQARGLAADCEITVDAAGHGDRPPLMKRALPEWY